jgi:predicted DNA-binding protein YlxM (UPF0122 family)
MAKLTDRQKNNIIAKWKTGQYTLRDIADLYKVDHKTIHRIVENIPKENADIIEAQTQLEIFKKSTKSPQEIAEINKSVETRLKAISDSDNLKLKIYETQMGVVDLIAKAVKKAKKQVPIKVKQYDSDGRVNGETVEIVEMELESSDLKNYAESVDKASLTFRVNERHAPKVEVNNTNAQHTITGIKLIDA